MHPSGIGLSLWGSVERFRCSGEQQHSLPERLGAVGLSIPAWDDTDSPVGSSECLETCQKAGVKREDFLVCPELNFLKVKQQKRGGREKQPA